MRPSLHCRFILIPILGGVLIVINFGTQYAKEGGNTGRWRHNPHHRVNGNPSKQHKSKDKVVQLFPQPDEEDDRLLEQLSLNVSTNKNLMILLWYGLTSDDLKYNHFEKCAVKNCHITGNGSLLSEADVVFFSDTAPMRPPRKPFPDQIWALFYLESPYNTDNLTRLDNYFNWTLTYRRDSVINTPYAKFKSFGNFSKSLKPLRNYALGKSKKVAWFVSHCKTPGKRELYAKELQKYMSVDIYGLCGDHICNRESDPSKCFNILKRDYKFYLAFENSICKDYITEKFFINSLSNDIVPIVMGARPEDYQKVAPPHSYIHVDDFDSPEQLAKYLHKLDKNDTLYNEYFLWKGTGEMINTKFWCRLCSMVNIGAKFPMSYEDLNKWWRGPGVCIKPSNKPWATWRNVTLNDTVQYGSDMDVS